MATSLVYWGHFLTMGWRNLSRRRATTRLLTIGLGAGVGIITVVLCVAANMEARLMARLPAAPERTVLVRVSEMTVAPEAGAAETGRIGRDDILALAALPGVERVKADIIGAPVGVSRENAQPSVIWAVAGSYSDIRDWLTTGRLPVPGLADQPASGAPATPECAISEPLSDLVLGARVNALGRKIRVFGRDFAVVGLLRPGRGGPPSAYLVVVPAVSLPPGGGTDHLEVLAAAGTGCAPVESSLRRLIESRLPAVTRLEVMSAEVAFEHEFSRARRTGLQASIIAGAMLLLACINVVTLSLTHVSERIEEIGLRRALGATQSAISLQITLECFLLALIGGLGGFLAALGTVVLLQWLGFPLTVTPAVMVSVLALMTGASLAVSLPVGRKAGKVDPQQALAGLR